MTIKDRQAAKPYNPLEYNRDQSPPAIIPFHEVPVGGEDDPDDPEYNEEHDLYWCFGRSAGGAQLWFGKYHGQRIYQTSWSYLHWCKSNLQKSWRFRQAFEIYAEGARNYAREHYKDFFVPLGRYYRGKTLKQCRDKPWMLHVQAKARREPEWREKNEAFFIALDEWLANPRKEQVKRDVGERLHPSQYDEDLGEVAEDEYDDQDLIDADADPDGNLKGFVVPDSVTPEPEEQEKDELDLADERLEAQRKAKRKARLTSSHKIMPEEDEISEDTDGDESEEEASSSSPQSEAYPTPPPETPKKSKQTRRAQSPSIIDDDGKVDDEADWVPDPEDQDSQVEETPRRLTRSMGRPKATGARSSPPATPSAHRRIAAAHLAPRTSRAKVLPTPAPESESDEVQARNPVKRPAKRKAIVDSTSEEEDNTPLSELRSRKRVKTGRPPQTPTPAPKKARGTPSTGHVRAYKT